MVKIAPNTVGVWRVGVLAGRKNVKYASVRNALKRTVLDHLTCLTGQPAGSGYDLLIIAAAPIIKLDSRAKNALLRDLKAVEALLLSKKTIK